ncbi:MAG: (d)CMP kinase [Pseudomonadota bacterium]|jgi:cytidylate kinase
MGFVVTIDGPAASGKSSVSRELARRMGWQWISTGAFYRGLAFVAHEEGVDLNDENALTELAHSPIWSVEMQPERTEVMYQGHSVTDAISREEVGLWASQVSRLPKVRESLLQAQRDCEHKTPGLVAEGRDCGSVVFPNAPLKVYLTADHVQRATRRAQDMGMSVEETVASQKVRDLQDSSRKAAPLQIPDKAWVLDTSDLTLIDAVGLIEARIREQFLSK